MHRIVSVPIRRSTVSFKKNEESKEDKELVEKLEKNMKVPVPSTTRNMGRCCHSEFTFAADTKLPLVGCMSKCKEDITSASTPTNTVDSTLSCADHLPANNSASFILSCGHVSKDYFTCHVCLQKYCVGCMSENGCGHTTCGNCSVPCMDCEKAVCVQCMDRCYECFGKLCGPACSWPCARCGVLACRKCARNRPTDVALRQRLCSQCVHALVRQASNGKGESGEKWKPIFSNGNDIAFISHEDGRCFYIEEDCS